MGVRTGKRAVNGLISGSVVLLSVSLARRERTWGRLCSGFLLLHNTNIFPKPLPSVGFEKMCQAFGYI